jgi:hypothetical protein
MLEKLRCSKNYVLKKLEDGKEIKHYALNIQDGDCYELNDTAYDILLMIQESLPMDAIFDKLQKSRKDLTREIFNNDHEELVKMCIEHGILLHE